MNYLKEQEGSQDFKLKDRENFKDLKHHSLKNAKEKELVQIAEISIWFVAKIVTIVRNVVLVNKVVKTITGVVCNTV